MKSEDLIRYLNSIDAKVNTEHQEFKINEYNLSVVLFEITTTTSEDKEVKYKVSIIANKDNSNQFWGNVSCATYESKQRATTYYNKLVQFLSSATIEEIKNLLHDK